MGVQTGIHSIHKCIKIQQRRFRKTVAVLSGRLSITETRKHPLGSSFCTRIILCKLQRIYRPLLRGDPLIHIWKKRARATFAPHHPNLIPLLRTLLQEARDHKNESKSEKRGFVRLNDFGMLSRAFRPRFHTNGHMDVGTLGEGVVSILNLGSSCDSHVIPLLFTSLHT